MTDDLRQRIAKALYGTYGQQDRHRSNAIADAVLATVQPELERMSQTIDYLKRNIRRSQEQVDGYDQELAGAKAAIARARALHMYVEDAGYCDVCSNHGEVTWPCATIAALDGQEATK